MITSRLLHVFVASGIVVFAADELRAQQLTAEEVLTPVGTSYQYLAIGGDDLPWDTVTPGPYWIWNYDWLPINSSNQTTVSSIGLLDIPGTTAFTEADHVLRTVLSGTGEPIYEFFDQQADRVLDLGNMMPTSITIASAGSIAFGLPMQLDDTLSVPWCTSFSGSVSGEEYQFCGNSYVTFDAVGTLVLPFVTFPNVKHVTRKKSSLWITDTPQDSTFIIEQLWYQEGITQPILEIQRTITSPELTFISGRMMDPTSTAVVEGTNRPVRPNISPNPTSGPLRIEVPPGGMGTIAVCDALGRSVWHSAIASAGPVMVVDISHLSDGAYTIQWNGPDGRDAQVVMKQGSE